MNQSRDITPSITVKPLTSLLLFTIFPILGFSEPAPKAEKELDHLQWVTGFHSLFEKASGFEFRVLEMDGSATVARDPIYLYFVATNNSSGDDLQSVMVKLPGVSKMEKVRLADQPGKILIDASLDRFNEEGSRIGETPVTMTISCPIHDKKLPEVIDVKVDPKP